MRKRDCMYKIVIKIFLIFTTLSCREIEKSIHINIINSSQYELSEIKVFVDLTFAGEGVLLIDSVDVGNLQPGEQISRPVIFNSESFPTSDGSHYLRFKQNNEIVGKGFGYFTNGYILDNGYKITITDDEVTVFVVE